MKIKESELERIISELIDEILGEETTTGDIAGYDAPMTRKKLKKRLHDKDEKDNIFK